MASAPLEESGFDDDLESLLNYDVNAPDASNDKNAQLELKSGESSYQATTTNVDEEVKIVKKRQPVPKLDQARLLSPAGIPRLRKIHKEKLKLKGKGHEFSDIARLLNMYQLWLDDLYPRAKFADALLMIEKLGHSKTMQMLRKQWIDEGKPKPPVEEYDPPSDMDEIAAEDRPMTDDGPPDPLEAEEGREHGTRDRRDLDNTNNASDTVQTTAASHSGKATEMDEMDELDALLAEQEAASGDHVEPGQAGKNQGTATQAIPGEDDFADEMEAMEGMDVPW